MNSALNKIEDHNAISGFLRYQKRRTDPRSGTKNRFPRLTANLRRRTSYFALSSVQRLLARGKRLFSANRNRLAVNQFLLLLRTCNHQPPTPAFFTTHNSELAAQNQCCALSSVKHLFSANGEPFNDEPFSFCSYEPRTTNLRPRPFLQLTTRNLQLIFCSFLPPTC